MFSTNNLGTHVLCIRPTHPGIGDKCGVGGGAGLPLKTMDKRKVSWGQPEPEHCPQDG